MKTKFWIVTIMMAVMCASCGKKEKQMLQMKVDSLTHVIQDKEFNMNEMNLFMDKVAEGLDSIHHQENIIYMGHHEITGKKLTRIEIKQRIKDLGVLVARQRTRIAELEDSMSVKVDGSSAPLKRIIASLQRQLQEKELTIQDLEAKLASSKKMVSMLQTDVKVLQETNKQQEEILDNQDAMMNEAFYIVGSAKELKQKGFTEDKKWKVWEKTQIKMDKSMTDEMNRVDIRNFSRLPLYGKKPKVLTDHPGSSYSIERKEGHFELVIKDAGEFWSLSRILVIQIR